MGRTRRMSYPEAVHHVTMRCNNKEFLFDELSFPLFLDILYETREMHGILLYNYCLMTNHVHLLFQVGAEDTLSKFMQRLANVFANRFNRMRHRKGHLWEGRFVSTIIEAPSCFLRGMAYLDLNPVRARIVEHPANYAWSAHRHVVAENTAMVQLHEAYLALGRTPSERSRAYRSLLAEEAARKTYSLAGTLFFGSKAFVDRMRIRFGITAAANSRFHQEEVRDGAWAVSLRRGGAKGPPFRSS